MLGRTTAFLHVNETTLRKFQEHLYPGIEEHGFLHLPDFQMRRKDGTVFPTEHSVMPLEDEEGKRIGWVSVVRDITERKKAEEALRESEEKFRSLFESMLNGFAYCKILVDEDNRPVDFVHLEVNDAWERSIGLRREDVIGNKITEVIPGIKESKTDLISIYGGVALTGEATKFDLCFDPLRKLFTVSVYSPSKGYFVAVFEDITERKRAEETLKKSRDAYKATFESTGTAMLIGEEDTTISIINTEFETLCGYSKEEVEGKKSWIEFLVKADLERMKDYHHLRMVDPNAAPPHYEFQFIDKQGNVKDILITLALIPGTKKTVGSLLEITERKRAEEQLKAAVRDKELLIREVHHRVKNNLQVISSLLDMSSLRTRSQPAQDLITNARSKIHSIAIIHSQLYASDRFEEVDMESHVRELVSYLLQIYAGAEHITPLVEVAAVKLQIDQAVPYAIVLNELISNALQHAFIGREKGTIRVSVERLAEGTLLTTVKDDGIGISPEVDIADADTLGLKLVRNVVQKQLKGKVRIKRNKGTEFIVEFKPLEKEVQYA